MTKQTKILLILIFTALTNFCIGQDSTLNFRNQIKFSPLRVIDLVNPGLEISYERKHNNKFSTQLSIANMIGIIYRPYDNYMGIRLSIEEKKYFLKYKKCFKPYYATEIVYYNTNFTTVSTFGYKNRFVDTLAYTYNYEDTFSVHKTTLALNLKLGFEIQIRKHFIFEVYAGIGIKYKNVQHGNRLVPSDEMEMPRHPNAYYIAIVEGNYLIINIPANFKIGYLF